MRCASRSRTPSADGLGDEAVIGTISLLIFALIFTVTAKYVLFLMRADNRGEGGILSLMALAQNALGRRATPVFLLGVAGAALFSGDAIITPAISVLSAVEGLDASSIRASSEYVFPITIAILVVAVLGAEPRHGAGRRAVRSDDGDLLRRHRRARRRSHIGDAPQVLRAFDPRHGFSFLLHHGWIGFAVLGSVFLVVTGAEALYADMGHFGRTPIQHRLGAASCCRRCCSTISARAR